MGFQSGRRFRRALPASWGQTPISKGSATNVERVDSFIPRFPRQNTGLVVISLTRTRVTVREMFTTIYLGQTTQTLSSVSSIAVFTPVDPPARMIPIEPRAVAQHRASRKRHGSRE